MVGATHEDAINKEAHNQEDEISKDNQQIISVESFDLQDGKQAESEDTHCEIFSAKEKEEENTEETLKENNSSKVEAVVEEVLREGVQCTGANGDITDGSLVEKADSRSSTKLSNFNFRKSLKATKKKMTKSMLKTKSAPMENVSLSGEAVNSNESLVDPVLVEPPEVQDVDDGKSTELAPNGDDSEILADGSMSTLKGMRKLLIRRFSMGHKSM